MEKKKKKVALTGRQRNASMTAITYTEDNQSKLEQTSENLEKNVFKNKNKIHLL